MLPRLSSSSSLPLQPIACNLSSFLAALQIAPSCRAPLSRFLDRISSSPAVVATLHTSSRLDSRTKRKPPSNPWAMAKAAEKREKVRARKEELRLLRKEAASDPVIGHTTSFLEATDAKPDVMPPVDHIVRPAGREQRQTLFEKAVSQERLGRLNHFLQKEEVTASLARSRELEELPTATNVDKAMRQATEMHIKATAAMNRILSLGNGSSGDKTRANKTWCIETFGRHVTQEMFPKPKHPSISSNPETDPVKTPRVGRDTGSSEVQAALLTMKIRSLAKQLETNTHDKMNKRNLRLMVHKRQKLLKYLKRKERGGERYRYVMESLGLDDSAIMKEVFM